MWSKALNRHQLFAAAGSGAFAGTAMPRPRLHLFEILALPALILSLADAFLTQYLVGIGRVQEGNPLMARLLEGNQFLGFKVIGISACLLLLWLLSRRFPRVAGGAVLFISVFYCAVLVWNSSVLA